MTILATIIRGSPLATLAVFGATELNAPVFGLFFGWLCAWAYYTSQVDSAREDLAVRQGVARRSYY